MSKLAAVAVLASALAGVLITPRLATGPVRIVTYDIQVKGEVESDLDLFRDHVRRTLRDPEGWSMGGDVLFVFVEQGGDFTMWLADAVELPGYSEVCSTDWSCRVGRNVVINETRWEEGAPGWLGDLDSYRHYVVNHEVGHWLGLGHRSCSVDDEPAPVMMQQSKSALPCRNRVWPDPVELADARASFLGG